jgi:hypothetical protein
MCTADHVIEQIGVNQFSNKFSRIKLGMANYPQEEPFLDSPTTTPLPSKAWMLLTSLYSDLRLYVNYFQPVLKLIAIEQVDGKTIKRYDDSTTPFHRVLAEELPLEAKVVLMQQYLMLNPVSLRKSIAQKVARLWKLVR